MSSITIPAGFGLAEGKIPYWFGRMSWKSNLSRIFLGILLILVGVLIIIEVGILFIIIGILLFINVALGSTGQNIS